MSTIILCEENNSLGERFGTLRPAMKAKPVETLQDYVRRVIAEKGLSHVKVAANARRLGGKLSPGYVNSVLQGHLVSPGTDMLKNLALGLGEPEDDVFDAARGKQLTNDRGFRESDFAMLHAEFKSLSDSDKRELRPMIDMLKREIERRFKG